MPRSVPPTRWAAFSILRAAGLSKRQAAARAGISHSAIRAMELELPGSSGAAFRARVRSGEARCPVCGHGEGACLP